MSESIGSLSLSPMQSRLIAVAQARLDEARRAAPGEEPHRSQRRMVLRWRDVAMVALLAALLSAGLFLLRPEIMFMWDQLILAWAGELGVPLASATGAGGRLQWQMLVGSESLAPTPLTAVITAAVVIAVFAATWWMSDRATPVKYLLRTLCVVQASALLYFMLVPSQFPYTVSGHLDAMLNAGYYLMLTLPVLLALGYSVLHLPWWQKLAAPVLMLAYFAVMLPHKALLHVLLLQHFSVLFMPLLYLCFGVVFDLMIFVALYSWLVSTLPEDALGREGRA